MSDGPVRIPPRFTGQAAQPQKAAAKPGQADAKKKPGGPAKKGDAPTPQPTTDTDSFSRSVGGASTIRSLPQDTPRAFLRLPPAGLPSMAGDLRQGGKLTVEYNPLRAHGHVVTAFLRFVPRGPSLSQPCVEVVGGQPRPSPVSVDVPLDAHGVDVWFRRETAGEPWDGTEQKPWAYPVKPRLPPTLVG